MGVLPVTRFSWKRGPAFLIHEGSGEGSIGWRLPLERYDLPIDPNLEAKGVKPAYLRFANLANAPVDALLGLAERYGPLGLHEASMKRLNVGARVYAGVLNGLGHHDEARQVMERLTAIE